MPVAIEEAIAFKIITTVQEKGRIVIEVPFAAGERVSISVISEKSELLKMDDESEIEYQAGRFKEFANLEEYKAYLNSL